MSFSLYAKDVQIGGCDESAGFVKFQSNQSPLGSRTCLSGQGDSFIRIDGSDSKTQITGGTGSVAKALARSAAGSLGFRLSPPPLPQIFGLHDASGSLMGGFPELLPGSGILVTARHVLQGQSREMIEDGLSSKGADLKNYLFFEVRRAGTNIPYDVVFAIPKGKESEILEDVPTCSACSHDGRITRVLRALSAFQKQPEVDDLYYSYQFGTVGYKETHQESQGKVSRATGIPIERFYLDLNDQNYTTARSSGSLVFLAPRPGAGAANPRPDWKPGGIVECQIEPRTSRTGVAVPGGIQVIPFSVLIDRAEFRQIPLEEILHESPRQDSDCKPIDGRGGGGE